MNTACWRRRISGVRLGIACILLFAQAAAVHADDLDQVAALVHDGAPILALHFLDREQPDSKTDPQGWMRWERERIRIYRQRRDWAAIAARLSKLPAGLPDAFARWATGELAAAHIARGDGETALKLLRGLIWSQTGKRDHLAQWRRLVIQAYLAEGDVNDAGTAMLRYQQDYGDGDREWTMLRARVLLRAGHPAEAGQLLARDRDPRSRALYYLARLRSGAESPDKIRRKAAALARKKGVPARAAYQLWIVAAQAARRAGEHGAEIAALSRALTDQPAAAGGPDVLFAANGDRLWEAYLDYGQVLGNRMQLLRGDDEDWYNAAAGIKNGIKARALFAVLALKSNLPGSRELGHEQFADRLAAAKHGITLLRALYLEPNHYAGAKDLPEKVRYQLADDALARSDIKLASRLMGKLSKPPKGVDPLFWQMRRARILIMGGDYAQGVAALRKLIQQHPKLPRKQIDRLMQVIFDLQSVGRHQDAIALFRSLPLAGQDGQLRREVLYWIAESYKALGQYENAARFYLRSAGLLDPDAMDPWAQSARYQAADALAQAGLRADARRVYKRLLKITKDPARRAVLRNRLQQLWLKPASIKQVRTGASQ